MGELGEPTAYLALVQGTPVLSSDGMRLGRVKRVLAVPEDDIFDGLIVDTPDGERFVDSERVTELYEHGVVLRLTAADARHMPVPSPAPVVMAATRGDVAERGSSEIARARRRAWDRISGNY
jgi:hypothetical protein